MTLAATDPTLALDHVEIAQLTSIDATVEVLGSKSYTNRYLAIASLASTPSTLVNALLSEDTLLLAEAIRRFGHTSVEIDEATRRITVTPTGAPMTAPADEIYMGNAGTPLRLLISMAGLAHGRTVITGNARMQERPMGHLLEALNPLGVPARALRDNGSPPIEVVGPSLRGGPTRISGSVSSQFTSSVLISSPYAEQDVELTVVDDLLSKPYVDMTIAAMSRAGVEVTRDGYRSFGVRAGQVYDVGEVAVEPDASGMSYFLAAAAILGGRVRIPGITGTSAQGDVGFVGALERMGCRTADDGGSVTVEGGDLTGIDIDMTNMPDVVPTLAVVAAYASGRTHITGIGNLRLKECDRIDAVSTELRKMGVAVDTTADTLTVHGGADPHGAVIDTYDDHRIAMAFAIAGLRTKDVVISEPGCVVKSFPTFWRTLDQVRQEAR